MIKSIIIKGASNSGKSTTIREICRKINLDEVYSLNINNDNTFNSSYETAKIDDIFNNIFIIKI